MLHAAAHGPPNIRPFPNEHSCLSHLISIAPRTAYSAQDVDLPTTAMRLAFQQHCILQLPALDRVARYILILHSFELYQSLRILAEACHSLLRVDLVRSVLVRGVLMRCVLRSNTLMLDYFYNAHGPRTTSIIRTPDIAEAVVSFERSG